MNMNSSTPMAIFVHQELKVPWNVMNVWISPRINTPIRVPSTYPAPPVRSVPPMTTAAMTSNSNPTQARGYPEKKVEVYHRDGFFEPMSRKDRWVLIWIIVYLFAVWGIGKIILQGRG